MTASKDDLAVRAYLEHTKLTGLSGVTLYARKRALARMSLALRPAPLLTATPEDVLAWRAALRVTDETLIGYVNVARSFYAFCVKKGLRDDNPADGLPVPRYRRRLPRPISEDKFWFALATAPPRVRPWLVLAAFCGLRAKEIAYLDRSSVMESADPPVLIVASDATKGRRERVIPLCDFALAELRAHGLPRAGYVFARADGRGGPNSPHIVSQRACKHLHDCGLSDTLHSLRHRFASRAYQASHNLRVVQDLLGHSSPTSTAGYAAYSDVDARAAVDALPVGPPPGATGKDGDMTEARQPGGLPLCPAGVPWCEHDHGLGDTLHWTDRPVDLAHGATPYGPVVTAALEAAPGGPPRVMLTHLHADGFGDDTARLSAAEAAEIGRALLELAGLADVPR